MQTKRQLKRCTQNVHPSFADFRPGLGVNFHILLTQNWLWESSLSLLSLWCILFQIKLGLFRENLNLKKHLGPKNGWSSPSTFWHRLIYMIGKNQRAGFVRLTTNMNKSRIIRTTVTLESMPYCAWTGLSPCDNKSSSRLWLTILVLFYWFHVHGTVLLTSLLHHLVLHISLFLWIFFWTTWNRERELSKCKTESNSSLKSAVQP